MRLPRIARTRSKDADAVSDDAGGVSPPAMGSCDTPSSGVAPGIVAGTWNGYTFGMKTAISIPNEVFDEAERLAKRLKKSRSQLYSEALREYLARYDSESTTERMNRVCEAAEERTDPWVEAAGRQVLERTEW